MRPLAFTLIFLFHLAGHAQNSSMGFNATNKYVEIADQNSIDLGASFTIEGWIQPTGAGSHVSEGGIILNKESSYEIALFSDGTLRYALSANGTGSDWGWVNTGIAVTTNVWSHFAMVKSGTSVTFYLNGKSLYTNGSNPAGMTGNSQNLRIGARTSSPQYFNGNIDELRIWNTARTQTEIKTNAFNKNLSNAASGLVAYYRFNEGSGTTAASSCSNTTGLQGTLVNSPAWVSSPVQFAANSLAFDGTDDQVTVPHSSSLNISAAITLEAWVYATKNSGIQNVISKSSSSANTGYIFPRTDNGWGSAVLYLHIGGAWRTLSAAFPSLNTWHHLAATYDGATMKIYINGNLAASQAQTGVIATNTNSLALGNQTGFSEYFGGIADEIRIWNIARTQTEIQNSMNIELPDPATQTGLVSYYSFNQGSAAGTNTGLTSLIDQLSENNGSLSGFSMSGSSSNFVAQYSGLGTLPVSWLYFTAQTSGPNVQLRWATAQEQNTSDFLLEHSRDGSRWSQIGQVAAAAYSQIVREYDFLHTQPGRGTNYYRIRQRDIDGHYSFSKIAAVVFSDITVVLSVFPNLTTSGMVTVSVKEKTPLTLYDSRGRRVFQTIVSSGTHPLNLTGYAKGMYYLKSEAGAARIIVQ